MHPGEGFIGGLAAAGAVRAQSPGKVSGFDHVALPMQNTEGMVAFYRGLGFEVAENRYRMFRAFRRQHD